MGEIFTLMKEKKDINWAKYRADKTLRMSPEERFEIRYIPSVKIGGLISNHLSSYPNKEEAAHAILDFHRSRSNDD